jgi:Tol biopolymer transport system component
MSSLTKDAVLRFLSLFAGVLLTACGSDSAVVGPPVGVNPLYNQILFDSDRDDLNRDIYAMNLDGTNVRRLTNSPFADFCPVVSPDGYRIAFYSSRLGDQLALYIMLADGSDVRYLEGPVRSDVCPRWSGSGNRVLFQRPMQGGMASVTTVETAPYDGSKVVTTVPAAVIPYADLSPDGGNILFGRYGENDPALTGIFIRSATTGKETVIDYEGYYSAPVSWSPDGKNVAYLCSALPPPQLNGNPALCLASPDGTNARKIDMGISYVDCQGIEWSPDSNFVVCPGTNARIVDVQSGTASAFPIEFAESVRWLGDNRRMAFVLETQFDKRDVFIAAFDGSGSANLTNNPADDLHPSFGPFH